MEQLHIQSFETVGANILINAYLYFPTKDEQRIYIGGRLVRYIYFGNTVLEKEEQDKVVAFKEYLTKNKLTLPNSKYYQDQRIMLFLSSNNFKNEQTYKCILNNRQWRLNSLPPVFTPKRKSILDNGYIYVCGRDHKFRPIIVLKQNLLESDLLDDYIMASIYGFQYIVNNLFLPGQVENWIFIHDLNGMGVFDLPIDSIKKVNAIMSNGYGGKLYRLYIVNAPFLISGIWTAAKYFIDPVTVQKISIDGGVKNLSKLFESCDKSQVQVKYGGTRPNYTNYWPPNMPNPVYKKQDLVSQKEYKRMYLDGKLINNFISPNIDDMSQ